MSFATFINESKDNPTSIHGMPSVLANFMHHLTTGTFHESETLAEGKIPLVGPPTPRVGKELMGPKAPKKKRPAFIGPHRNPELFMKDGSYSLKRVMKAGQEAQSGENLYKRMKAGFHAAIVADEDPAVTERKAAESRRHFRQFMADRGGHSESYSSDLTTENGKTQLSTGAGFQTIGIGMAPHGSSGLENFDLCPNASTECKKNCLGFTAGGNKQYPEPSLKRKVLVTQYFTEHPEHAARLLSKEISENEKWSDKNGMRSGVRLNVTSDIPYEKMMPEHFWKRHAATQFYDYTKNAKNTRNLPANYFKGLSHTGTGHDESNDKQAIEELNRGGVVAMVYQRGKKIPNPTHVEDVQTGKRWRIVNGDDDDNLFDRHANAGIPKTEGVVSGLKLKGVKNEDAGKFANKVDPDGIIRINHPAETKASPIRFV
jgi:hypothetical protein